MSDELTESLGRRFEGEKESPDETTDTQAESEPEQEASKPEAEAEAQEPEPTYDPETDPAFPYNQSEMQNSVYVRPETWKQYQTLRKMTDAQATAKGYEGVAGRELDDAILRAVADLDAEDVAELVAEAREKRAEE